MPDVIEKALATHEVIKQSMKRAIRNADRLDPDGLRSDHTCAFGEWIYKGNGRVHQGRPEFEAMKLSHRRFHEAAYVAACLCRTGDRAAAEKSIENGPFEDCAADLRQRLITLKAVIRRP
jgi:hypothetical protein